MASSTDQIDALLEWRPAPPEAGTTHVLRALLWGARRAWRAKLLICYLWLFYTLLVAGAGGAFLTALRSSAGLTEAASAWASNLAVTTGFGGEWLPLTYRVVVLKSIARQLWSPSAYFILFYGLFAGGIISYLHAPRPAPLLAQLGGACGTYVGRFSRLLMIAAIAVWTIVRGGTELFSGGASGDAVWLRLGALLCTLWLLAAVLDYARVRTVARDSRSMLLEVARSARFFARNLPRTLALEGLILLLTASTAVLAVALASGLSLILSPRSTAFVAEQLLLITLLWVRVAAWGAMLSLYQGIALRRWSQKSA